MNISIGVGCVISSITMNVTETPDGWHESVDLSVVSQGQCDAVDLSAPRNEVSEITSMKVNAPGSRAKRFASELVQQIPGDAITGPTTRFHLGGLG